MVDIFFYSSKRVGKGSVILVRNLFNFTLNHFKKEDTENSHFTSSNAVRVLVIKKATSGFLSNVKQLAQVWAQFQLVIFQVMLMQHFVKKLTFKIKNISCLSTELALLYLLSRCIAKTVVKRKVHDLE